MKNIKQLFIVFISMALWNCVDSDFEVVEEDLDLSSSEFRIIPQDAPLDQILLSGYMESFGDAVITMFRFSLGKKLIKTINSGRPYIYFVRNSALPVGAMRYAGSGKIYYSDILLDYEYLDVVLFHEFFHIYQNKDQSPEKSLNNEVEAYLAQYLYDRQKGNASGAPIGDNKLSSLIFKLAKYVDEKTGELKKGINMNQYREAYSNTVSYIKRLPMYNDGEWFSDINTWDFPNFVKLLKQSV